LMYFPSADGSHERKSLGSIFHVGTAGVGCGCTIFCARCGKFLGREGADAHGKIQFWGGCSERADIRQRRCGGTQSKELTAANEEYNPATNTWTEKAPMPTPRYGCAVATYGNKIYVFGGGINDSGCANETVVYDPATNTWATKASMPTARDRLCVVVVDDRLYAIGGTRATIDLGLNDNEQYTPVGYGTPDASVPSSSPPATQANTDREPSWINLAAAASVVSATAVGIGLLVYFRKRNGGRN